jgi:hypothetical protein
MTTSSTEQRFGPTSGLVTGWLGLAFCACLIGAMVLGERSVTGLRVSLAAALAAVLVWCFLLRPRVILRPPFLVLRNPLSEWRLALADVRDVDVRAVTGVYTDSGRYDAVAVGRSVRQMLKRDVVRPDRQVPAGPSEDAADLLVQQVLGAAEHARAARQPGSEPARRWAVPEVSLIGLLAVGLLLTLLL